ncbi:STM4014 family protein [Actinoplanes sp. NPDC020271]|uniref:STM4014 family protein n=1 Tax=Actinoplanes sp. NPDC020271 TaxID=3363896 RepID=UPI0037A17770
MRLAVVGNPENRRVALFSAAVERAGLRAPEVFAWRDVLVPGRVPGPGTLVRIESPGENAEVDRLLRGLGGDHRAAAHGEIRGAAAGFTGLSMALERIAAGGGTLLNQPADILTMTAKPRCHAALAGAGIAVPPALEAPVPALARAAAPTPGVAPPTPGVAAPTPGVAPPTPSLAPPTPSLAPLTPGLALPSSAGSVTGYESLRAAMDSAGWSRVFVKAAYGSSASGVLALAVGGRRDTPAGRRIMAMTSVELSNGKIFNNLRVRRYDEEASIAAIIDRLAPDGLHVECWYPKAALDGRVLDLRVVVIAGRARHVVVRTSRSPMTNLHLGNARGDVTAVRAAVGEQQWEAAMDTCVRAAGCFPGTLHAGVDLMFRTGWREHAVAEVNAFGDLLPRVLSEDGLDTYDAQVAALRAGWSPP